MSWSSDGRWLAFEMSRQSTGGDIGLLGAGDDEYRVLMESAFDESWPMFSPVDPVIAYEASQTNEPEIWVRTYDDALGAPAQVSRGGGRHPFWAPDGRTLYYTSGNTLMAVPMTVEPALDVGVAQAVLELRNQEVYGVGQDGRFLAVQYPEFPHLTQLHLVLNWFEELQARVPTP